MFNYLEDRKQKAEAKKMAEDFFERGLLNGRVEQVGDQYRVLTAKEWEAKYPEKVVERNWEYISADLLAVFAAESEAGTPIDTATIRANVKTLLYKNLYADLHPGKAVNKKDVNAIMDHMVEIGFITEV